MARQPTYRPTYLPADLPTYFPTGQPTYLLSIADREQARVEICVVCDRAVQAMFPPAVMFPGQARSRDA